MAEGEEDDSSKTEEPTPRKLEESRKKGQIALSKELNNWIMLLTGTIVIAVLAGPVFTNLSIHMKTYIEMPHLFPRPPGGVAEILGEMFFVVLAILSLPLILLFFMAFLGPFIQVGPLFAPEVLKPDVSKISPLKGFKRLFSMRALMEFAKGVLKLGIITAVGMILIMPYFGTIEHLIGMPLLLVLDELMALFVRLMLGVLVVLIVIAVIDVAFQRTEHMKKMRMTKQEIKDEYKQTEGDPHVRAKLRQLRAERGRQRMIQAVPSADVVITNPTHFSIALKYDPDEMDAPVCVAKGSDDLALRIREVAKEHNVTIYQAPPLARVLYDTIEIDQMVPADQFKAVAEVISYVFRMKGKMQ